MSEPYLLSEDHGPVRRLILNRPERRNPLSIAMMSALDETLARAQDDPACHVVVLAAAGPAFCAGHDLKELTDSRSGPDGGRAAYQAAFTQCAALMQRIIALPQPVIAEVHGIATAAGCQLVASCDLAVAGASARFATPGVNIGLFCCAPMVALSRNVPRKHAMEMLFTGNMVSAEDAVRLGLVNRVVPDADLAAATMTFARTIAAKPRKTVATGKAAFYRQVEMPLSEAYAYTAQVMAENMMAADAREGIGAFLEKRTPKWLGTED